MISQYQSTIHNALEASPLENAFPEVLNKDQHPQSPLEEILPDDLSEDILPDDLSEQYTVESEDSPASVPPEPPPDQIDVVAPQKPKTKPGGKKA